MKNLGDDFRELCQSAKFDTNDLKFFTPLATLIGFLLYIVPNNPFLNVTNFLNSLILDHIVLTTIITMFFIQTILMIVIKLIGNNCIAIYLSRFSNNLTHKLRSFCSVAISIIIGLIVPAFVIDISHCPSTYYVYAFLVFIVFFEVINILTNIMNNTIQDNSVTISKRLLYFSLGSIVAMFVFYIWQYETNHQITINLSSQEFNQIQEMSKNNGISVEEQIRLLIKEK